MLNASGLSMSQQMSHNFFQKLRTRCSSRRRVRQSGICWSKECPGYKGLFTTRPDRVLVVFLLVDDGGGDPFSSVCGL